MPIRNIQHPDVELNEIDLSQYTPGLAVTNNLILGFSDRGEELIPRVVTSKNSFLNIYGNPQNDAERYAFAAAEEIFNQNGGVIFSKLPYANDATGKYRVLKAELIDSTIQSRNDLTDAASGVADIVEDLFGASGDAVGVKRIAVDESAKLITTEEFDDLRTINQFPVSITAGSSGPTMAIINKSRDTVIGEEENGGTFVAIVPAYQGIMKTGIDSSTSGYYNWAIFDGITSPSGAVGSKTVWTEDADFAIPTYSTVKNTRSISKSIAANFPSISRIGTDVDKQYLGQVTVLVCKTFYGENYDNRLSVGIVESFTGSLNNLAQNSKGQSIFIGDVINDASEYIEFYLDIGATDYQDYLVKSNETALYSVVTEGLENEGASIITWPLLSFSKAESSKYINNSSLLNNIDTALEKVKNIDEYEIDTVVDAGVSSIAQYVQNTKDGQGKALYTPDIYDQSEIGASTDVEAWRTVCDKYIEFCQFTRRDCVAILDGPRGLVLKGNKKIIRSTNVTENFDNQIGPKLRYISGLNTNFAAMYVNWLKILDQYTGKIVWLPQSTSAVGSFNYVDRALNIFEAPAGLNNGRISGINDIAFNPDGEQADQLYTLGFNYAKKWPFQGFTIEGQKTLQNKSSAFDRINVRRMFLRVERLFRKVALEFVYRPNNFVTRSQLYDLLAPILEQLKSAGGIEAYLLVINEENNTPEVIDNNELKIAVFIKPTKIAEYIRATFIATRQGVVLDELQNALLPQF